ncbi:MAG: glutaminyl-peptide cyclotransferase [Halioglobus sp.]|nr:glutaminyl-peptide cyclotransferase [Halioglobus sp.]
MRMLRALLLALCLLPAFALAVPQYGYRIVDKKPQSRENFVQGLEIVDGYLYVSSGNYGQSRLLRYHFADGALERARQVDPRLFAEGLTVFKGRIYQLTWRSRVVLVYDAADFKGLEWFRIPGEGWGLTHDAEQLIYSDGSDKLHFLSPETHRITRSLAVTEDGAPLPRLNELEWIDGRIWANVWLAERIVIIDPASGRVTASIDLSALLPDSERRAGTDVLNGIAHDPADGSVWVTGKRWPWLYRIELVAPQDTPGQDREPSISR